MLTVIGEAAKMVSPELREGHPEIPWREAAGMRDKIVHHYFGVDSEAVFLTVHTMISRSSSRGSGRFSMRPGVAKPPDRGSESNQP